MCAPTRWRASVDGRGILWFPGSCEIIAERVAQAKLTLLRVPGVDALTRLALAAKDGDRRALDQLVEGIYEQVWRLCARLVDDQCADDLAQDTFIQPLVPYPTSVARPQLGRGSWPSPAIRASRNCGRGDAGDVAKPRWEPDFR